MLLAYIDPGSSSLIFQLLIGGLMSASFIFRKTFLVPFKMLFRFFKKQKNEQNDQSPN